MMKYVTIISSLIVLSIFAGLLLATGTAPAANRENAPQTAEKPTWEIPIAAGVWYPSDGAVPEKPMRYYRVRCWPGCHTGSAYGKYPHKPLNDNPIYPTSTIGAHSKSSAGAE